MPTECIPELFEFPRVEHRAVVADFNGGRITSDAGALLLGQTNRALNLTHRLAGCFTDARSPTLVEHAVETLLLQRISKDRRAVPTNAFDSRSWGTWSHIRRPAAVRSCKAMLLGPKMVCSLQRRASTI